MNVVFVFVFCFVFVGFFVFIECRVVKVLGRGKAQ